MRPVPLLPTIKVGLFEQGGGWVFIVTRDNFYSDAIASGKRKSLAAAMDAAKEVAPDGHPLVFSRLDNLSYDWII